MTSTLKITPVQNNQIYVLRTVAEETFIEAYTDSNTPESLTDYTAKYFTLEHVSAEFHKQGSCFFFAYQNGDLAGYLKLNTGLAQTSQELGNAMEIERIYAKRAFQNKGIGKALMQKSMQAATTKKADWLWLGVWEENVHAIEFYSRQGFQAFGQREFLLGGILQNDILMKLPTEDMPTK